MHIAIFYGLIIIVQVVAVVKIQMDYHKNVGIPTAKRIKAYEEELLTEAADVSSRIAGGLPSSAGEHPYIAGLLIDLTNATVNSLCGSSLLTSNRLVTAAHCWYDGDFQAWQFHVVLGTNFLYSGGIRIPTRKVFIHPRYNHVTLENDISMIYLPKNVYFSEKIVPISLPTGPELNDQFVGRWATAVGFGKPHMGQVSTQEMYHVKVQVITTAACAAVFSAGFVRHSTLCTNGTGGVGICSGDSGGPLLIILNGRLVLIGISSFVALDGCKLGQPSAFTRVTSHHDFIVQHL